MGSRLSSLLVRDGLVGVKRMEKAFQRQVIYGGSLDTILLEMGLVHDERLTQYLSLASGLPPAGRNETNVFDVEAVKRVPEELAHRYHVVPLMIEGDAVRVLVHEPVDMAGLEELADQIDHPIQPLIVPEYRWHVVYARAYNAGAPARFTTLAKTIDAAPTTPPVGKGRTVVVDPHAPGDSAQDHQVVDVREVAAQAAQAEAQAGVPLRPVGPEAMTMRFDAAKDPENEPHDTTEMPAMVPHSEEHSGEIAVPEYVRPRQTVRGHAIPEPMPPHVHLTPGDAVIRAPLSTGETPDVGDTAAMSVVVAREALAVAEDRDRIFLLLLRALRSRARWAGLLTVQGGAAIGRVAIAESGADVSQISSVLIPLDLQSPFRAAVTGQRPFVGNIATGDHDIDSMIERMGGVMPPSALLLPVVMRERVVALAVAHRMDVAIGLADVAELLPIAGVAADAIGRLIVRHKAAGYRSPADMTQVTVEDVDDKHIQAKHASAWRIPTAQPSVPIEMGTEVNVPDDMRTPAQLLDAIEGSPDGAAEPLYSEAVERAAQVIPLIAQRFPGTLRVDRYQVTGRPLRAAQYGTLLELIVRIGSPVTDVLVEKMSDPHRDIRFYATVCTGEMRPRSAVYALVERLFDSDYGVRSAAIEALTGYPLRELDSALARARHALHSEDPERVLAAATAVAELGDVAAIPDLLDTVGRDARRAEHARRGLVALSKQDFGTSERKWRRWWEDHKKQHRIEWLIEGLGHKEMTVRRGAADDLRRLTGEHFGYHHDLPKRDRETSQQRWRQWWNETGRRRFARDDDERLRPTAMLPVKRD